MDEASLEAAIEVYKAQLQQVEAALGAGAQAEAEAEAEAQAQADLLQLQADLQQLVALTESSLLSVRKSLLLEQLQRGASSPEPEDQSGLDVEYAAFQAALSEAERSREQEPGSGDEAETKAGDISGTKVRAPYRPAWGPLQYHNAMVVGVEADQPSEPTVRVLWIHPTQRAMKPCPFYLSGSCRFLDSCSILLKLQLTDTFCSFAWKERDGLEPGPPLILFPRFIGSLPCPTLPSISVLSARYSHGEVVAVSELREFEELDLSSLEVGSSCLAKYEDEIWYPAKILDIDNGYFTVKFDSLLQKEIVVEGDGIMPLAQADESSSSSSSEDEGELGYAKEKIEHTEKDIAKIMEALARNVGSVYLLCMKMKLMLRESARAKFTWSVLLDDWKLPTANMRCFSDILEAQEPACEIGHVRIHAIHEKHYHNFMLLFVGSVNNIARSLWKSGRGD
eukprot:g48307.t1